MVGMFCNHNGFHTIRTSYDHRGGLLIFHWTCERCGARLTEARRERYRPSFDPRGNEAFLTHRAASG
jgi:C4-type Zn-finger protein